MFILILEMFKANRIGNQCSFPYNNVIKLIVNCCLLNPNISVQFQCNSALIRETVNITISY